MAVEKQKSQEHQSRRARRFRDRENILNDFAEAQAARVDPGEQDDGKNGEKILAIQADVVWAERAEPEMPGTERADFPDPLRTPKTTEPARR